MRPNAPWLIFIYILLTVVMGISALMKGAIYPGVAGIVGPTLCWFAGSRLKGSLLVGSSRQKLTGLVSAIVFVTIGTGIVYHSGYWVGIFGYELTGVTWCLIGLAAGWTSTTRQDAGSPLMGAQERIINKADADMMFAFTRAEWERYVREVAAPDGWALRLQPMNTGTVLTRRERASGIVATVQPLFSDDTGPPHALVISTYYPPSRVKFTDEALKNIEAASRLDLGPTYSVRANHAKMPEVNLEGVELMVMREASGPKGSGR